MSPLNLRPSMDRRWPLHHRSVPDGFRVAEVLIVRRQDVPPTWDPITGNISGDSIETIYFGRARLQPNKDWRARKRVGENAPMVQHAFRAQMPSASCPPILWGDILVCMTDPFNDDSDLTRYIWGRSILLDVDLTENAADWPALEAAAIAAGWTGG
jgi:hypothetical protein